MFIFICDKQVQGRLSRGLSLLELESVGEKLFNNEGQNIRVAYSSMSQSINQCVVDSDRYAF